MLSEWLAQRRSKQEEAQASFKTAEAAFLRAYPERSLIVGMSGIFHQTDDFVVVQVCHDWGGKPPRRTWWRIAADASCRELTREQADAIEPVPEWR